MSDDNAVQFPKGEIEIRQIDELRTTRVRIACYRETFRLDRLLHVFHKALTLAHRDGKDHALLQELVELYDHKGILTVMWRRPLKAMELKHYVERAWKDECECLAVHQDEDGQGFAVMGNVDLNWQPRH
jgi:hypothetical protein